MVKKPTVTVGTKAFPWNASLSLPMPDGDEGTYCTALAMKAMAEHAAQMPVVRDAARALRVRGRPCTDEVYFFLRNNQKFTRDAKNVEHLRHPAQLLDTIARGEKVRVDCDDIAMLGCALLLARGHRCGIVVLGRREYPAKFVHVFYCTHRDRRPQGYAWPENYLPAGFTPWDPQEHKRVPKGKMAKPARRVRVFPV